MRPYSDSVVRPHVVTLILVLCLTCLQIGCGSSRSKPTVAPSNLNYPATTIAAVVGQPIATDTPTVTGTVTTWLVSPSLPVGLNINTSTGAIFGTPTAAAAQKSYTVTASNAIGSTTAVVQITVTAALAAPSNLSYPQNSIVDTVGTAIATDTPTVTGTVTTWLVSPSLPAGLNFNTSTGAISGTPTAAAALKSYTVTASNASGSTKAVVQITVNAVLAAPSNLSYTTATIAAIEGDAITSDTATVTGTVTTWSIVPALPAGLKFNTSSGAITGTPTAVSASSSYTVKAANASGSTTAVLQVGVVASSVNQAVHSTMLSGHQSFHAALNYTYTPLNFVLPSSSPLKPAFTRALRSRLTAVRPSATSAAQPSVSFNADLGLYVTDMVQNGNSAAINYYVDSAATIPAGATTLTLPSGVLAGNYTNLNYPVNIPITQNITAGKIPCTGSGTIVILDSTGKNTIQGSLTLTNVGLTVTADISLDDNLNVTGSGTIAQNGELISVSNMFGPFTGNIAGGAVLTPQNYNGTANISILSATFSAVFQTPEGLATGNSANGLLYLQYPDGTTETLTDPNETQPNAPPAPVNSSISSLSYALSSIDATQGQVIINDTPTVTGTPTAWSITPTLPTGLAISAANGMISGTPTVVSPATDYVVTASNASGFTHGVVNITVNAAAAPSGLSYSQSSISATVGTAIASDTPTVTGTVTNWGITPPLPGGLSLDPSSGVISGTPTATSPQTIYTITAGNSGGSTTTTVQITVATAVTGPISITYPVTTIVTTEDTAITPDVPTVVGTLTGWAVSPVLPYGLTLDPTTGTISGTPATQLPTTTFTVGAYQVGSSPANWTNTTIQITIREAPVQGIAAQDAIFTGSTLNLASFASSTATSFQWSLIDQSSGGTITSGTSSDLIQYTANTTPGTYELSVTTQATTAARTLHVVNEQFLKDPTSSWDRGTPSSSVLANGSILFVGTVTWGGYAVDSSTAFHSTELFDPVSNTFSTTAGLNTVRYGGQAQVTLSNGKVLVCGGQTTNPNAGVGGEGYTIGITGAEIYDPSADTWTTAASMNTVRSWHSATLLQSGKVLVAGGEDSSGNILNSAEIYDPVANTWTTVASLNSARNQHAAFLLSGGTVLVVGGSALPFGATGSNPTVAAVEVYDPVANTWTVGGIMETPRINNTATPLSSGKVLVSGGFDKNYNILSSAELYDPTAKTWSYAASMITGTYSHAATLLSNGKVLVEGGQDSNGNNIATAEIYDPVGNTWTAAANLNTPRYDHFAALLPSGNVLVAYGPCLYFLSGICNTGSGITISGYTESIGTAELYNVAANTWTPVGMTMQLPGYLTTYFTPGFTVTQLSSGQLLLAGGTSTIGENAATTAQLFNPTTNTWKVAAAMNTARADHTATLLQNGKVLVTGGDLAPGYESSGYEYPGVLSSVEIYDPTANTWTPAASLLTARTQHTATLLASGKVLVAGGADANGNPVATAELYDPTTNTWSAAGTLITPRILHTATLLGSGEVLLAGGESLSAGAPITSGLTAAELYNPSTNSWSAAAAMPAGVERQTATLLGNGTVVIAGGDAGGISGSTGAAQLYTPATNTWSSLATMNEYRTGHAATLLSNGQILVTGGTGLAGIVSQSELYSPTANTWTLAAPLNLPRYLQSSIQLSDGRVMIVGGTPGYIPEFWKP